MRIPPGHRWTRDRLRECARVGGKPGGSFIMRPDGRDIRRLMDDLSDEAS